MQRSVWWTIWIMSTVLLLAIPVEAAIEYVVQESERSTRQDGSSVSSTIWVEVNPQVNGMTLTIPPWTCYYHGEQYSVPGRSFTLKAHPRGTTSMVLYLVFGHEGMEYLWRETGDPISGATRQPQLEENAAEAVAILWCDVPSGTTELATIPIYVLKHVHA